MKCPLNVNDAYDLYNDVIDSSDMFDNINLEPDILSLVVFPQIGHVTSGTMSPIRKIGIGMGYVKAEYAKPGTEIWLDNRGRKLKAQVVKPPFRH